MPEEQDYTEYEVLSPEEKEGLFSKVLEDSGRTYSLTEIEGGADLAGVITIAIAYAAKYSPYGKYVRRNLTEGLQKMLAHWAYEKQSTTGEWFLNAFYDRFIDRTGITSTAEGEHSILKAWKYVQQNYEKLPEWYDVKHEVIRIFDTGADALAEDPPEWLAIESRYQDWLLTEKIPQQYGVDIEDVLYEYSTGKYTTILSRHPELQGIKDYLGDAKFSDMLARIADYNRADDLITQTAILSPGEMYYTVSKLHSIINDAEGVIGVRETARYWQLWNDIADLYRDVDVTTLSTWGKLKTGIQQIWEGTLVGFNASGRFLYNLDNFATLTSEWLYSLSDSIRWHSAVKEVAKYAGVDLQGVQLFGTGGGLISNFWAEMCSLLAPIGGAIIRIVSGALVIGNKLAGAMTGFVLAVKSTLTFLGSIMTGALIGGAVIGVGFALIAGIKYLVDRGAYGKILTYFKVRMPYIPEGHADDYVYVPVLIISFSASFKVYSHDVYKRTTPIENHVKDYDDELIEMYKNARWHRRLETESFKGNSGDLQLTDLRKQKTIDFTFPYSRMDLFLDENVGVLSSLVNAIYNNRDIFGYQDLTYLGAKIEVIAIEKIEVVRGKQNGNRVG